MAIIIENLDLEVAMIGTEELADSPPVRSQSLQNLRDAWMRRTRRPLARARRTLRRARRLFAGGAHSQCVAAEELAGLLEQIETFLNEAAAQLKAAPDTILGELLGKQSVPEIPEQVISNLRRTLDMVEEAVKRRLSEQFGPLDEYLSLATPTDALPIMVARREAVLLWFLWRSSADAGEPVPSEVTKALSRLRALRDEIKTKSEQIQAIPFHARNASFIRTGGPLLARLGEDLSREAGWLDSFLEAFEKNVATSCGAADARPDAGLTSRAAEPRTPGKTGAKSFVDFGRSINALAKLDQGKEGVDELGSEAFDAAQMVAQAHSTMAILADPSASTSEKAAHSADLLAKTAKVSEGLVPEAGKLAAAHKIQFLADNELLNAAGVKLELGGLKIAKAVAAVHSAHRVGGAPKAMSTAATKGLDLAAYYAAYGTGQATHLAISTTVGNVAAAHLNALIANHAGLLAQLGLNSITGVSVGAAAGGFVFGAALVGYYLLEKKFGLKRKAKARAEWGNWRYGHRLPSYPTLLEAETAYQDAVKLYLSPVMAMAGLIREFPNSADALRRSLELKPTELAKRHMRAQSLGLKLESAFQKIWLDLESQETVGTNHAMRRFILVDAIERYRDFCLLQKSVDECFSKYEHWLKSAHSGGLDSTLRQRSEGLERMSLIEGLLDPGTAEAIAIRTKGAVGRAEAIESNLRRALATGQKDVAAHLLLCLREHVSEARSVLKRSRREIKRSREEGAGLYTTFLKNAESDLRRLDEAIRDASVTKTVTRGLQQIQDLARDSRLPPLDATPGVDVSQTALQEIRKEIFYAFRKAMRGEIKGGWVPDRIKLDIPYAKLLACLDSEEKITADPTGRYPLFRPSLLTLAQKGLGPRELAGLVVTSACQGSEAPTKLFATARRVDGEFVKIAAMYDSDFPASLEKRRHEARALKQPDFSTVKGKPGGSWSSRSLADFYAAWVQADFGQLLNHTVAVRTRSVDAESLQKIGEYRELLTSWLKSLGDFVTTDALRVTVNDFFRLSPASLDAVLSEDSLRGFASQVSGVVAAKKGLLARGTVQARRDPAVDSDEDLFFRAGVPMVCVAGEGVKEAKGWRAVVARKPLQPGDELQSREGEQKSEEWQTFYVKKSDVDWCELPQPTMRRMLSKVVGLEGDKRVFTNSEFAILSNAGVLGTSDAPHAAAAAMGGSDRVYKVLQTTRDLIEGIPLETPRAVLEAKEGLGLELRSEEPSRSKKIPIGTYLFALVPEAILFEWKVKGFLRAAKKWLGRCFRVRGITDETVGAMNSYDGWIKESDVKEVSPSVLEAQPLPQRKTRVVAAPAKIAKQELRRARKKSTGFKLDVMSRAMLEQLMGRSLGEVDIFVGQRADQLARKMNAEAFAIDSRVFLADGRFHTSSREGLSLLAHELTHVAQTQTGETQSRSTDSLEAEAEAIERRVEQKLESPSMVVARESRPAKHEIQNARDENKAAGSVARMRVAEEATILDEVYNRYNIREKVTSNDLIGWISGQILDLMEEELSIEADRRESLSGSPFTHNR